jgi:hypothetical protein
MQYLNLDYEIIFNKKEINKYVPSITELRIAVCDVEVLGKDCLMLIIFFPIPISVLVSVERPFSFHFSTTY